MLEIRTASEGSQAARSEDDFSGCHPGTVGMLFSGGALKRQQKNADILVKKTDGIAGIFAEFLPDQFRFAIP